MENPQLLTDWCRAKHGRTTLLARKIGRSRVMVLHYRRGTWKPSEETAKAIERATEGAVPAADW